MEKITALTIWTFVSKVMSLLFNMLSRFLMVFFSKEKVSFNYVATVTVHSDFGSQENKISHCFHFFPIYLQFPLILSLAVHCVGISLYSLQKCPFFKYFV